METISAQIDMKLYTEITNILSLQRMNPYVFGLRILVV